MAGYGDLNSPASEKDWCRYCCRQDKKENAGFRAKSIICTTLKPKESRALQLQP
jgi:hypothetical protein